MAAFTEPVLGWRTWTLRRASHCRAPEKQEEDVMGLWSTVQGFRWPEAAPLQAEHRTGGLGFWPIRGPLYCTDGSPGTVKKLGGKYTGCRVCGIYAHQHIDQASRDYGNTRQRKALPHVMGAVLLWGRIIVHSDGARAQYAQPLCLLNEFVTQKDEFGKRKPVTYTTGVATKPNVTVEEPYRHADWLDDVSAVARLYRLPLFSARDAFDFTEHHPRLDQFL